MSDELRAAAERLLALPLFAKLEQALTPEIRHSTDATIIRLARAYLAASPADDAEPTREGFLVALYALMDRFGVIVDHNHDAESLSDGWHFKGTGWRVEMGTAHRRGT